MPRRKRFQHRKKNEKEKRMKSETSNNSPLQLQSLPEDSTVEVCSLQQLSTALTLPSREWINRSPEGLDMIQVCKNSQASCSSSQPLRIIYTITVSSDLAWSLFVYDHKINLSECSALNSFPILMDAKSLNKLVLTVDSLHVCAGQPDHNFVNMIRAKKGKFSSSDGTVSAVIDDMPVQFEGSTYSSTVRTTKCEILCTTVKCSACTKYRASLRSMYHRSSKKVSAQCIDSSCAFTNERYLNTPQKKTKMEKLRSRARKAEQSVHSLTVKVLKLTSQGERLDTSFQSDLLSIMHGSQQL